ncbi:hypothetical protein [uncultured Rikenella sp.]|nr:hypothetical protein [uncultured Rikenella sp.]
MGLHGYSWSSSATNGTYGFFLWFATEVLVPCHSLYRGHGFQLRCLSE